MRYLLYGLTHPNTDTAIPARCCDDRPAQMTAVRPPAAPVRAARKVRNAIGPSFALFRHQIAQPLNARVDVGTPVVSSSGLALGTVSGVVVEIGSGRTSYAVSAEDPQEGRVLLLPRESLREDHTAAVIDDRVLWELTRRSA